MSSASSVRSNIAVPARKRHNARQSTETEQTVIKRCRGPKLQFHLIDKGGPKTHFDVSLPIFGPGWGGADVMKLPYLLVALLVLPWAPFGVPPSTNEPKIVLIVGRSSAAVAGGGKATLSIDPLKGRAEIYEADYEVKVSPYFFKSETGRLAIVISNEAIADATKSIPVELTGTATTDGKAKARRIDITAVPTDDSCCSLKIRFMAGDRKVVFNTTYRIVRT